jgi:hypothetical protein
MPKGLKSRSMPNESYSIVGCPLCDWRCERKGSKQFLKKIMLTHLKINHNLIMTLNDLDKFSHSSNYRYKNWETTGLHKALTTTMDAVLKKK